MKTYTVNAYWYWVGVASIAMAVVGGLTHAVNLALDLLGAA